MSKSRHQRNEDFEKFLGSAEERFNALKDSDDRAKYFESIYSFHSVSGGRIGGMDKRIFEVFFGKRPYDSIHRDLKLKHLVEEGSTLMIQVNDIGKVYVSIFPAKTEFRSLQESSITLHKSIEPSQLLSDRFIKKIWNNFISYTEYSSLDGDPSFWDKLRVRYLWYVKNIVIDTKEQETRLSKMIVRFFELIVTIGFSGFLIFIISLIINTNQESKLIEKLEHINKSVIELSKTIDQIRLQQLTKEDLNVYLNHLDSLIQSSTDTILVKSLDEKPLNGLNKKKQK